MLNEVNFAKKGGEEVVDLCPPCLEEEIDAMNDFVYEKASKGMHAVFSI